MYLEYFSNVKGQIKVALKLKHLFFCLGAFPLLSVISCDQEMGCSHLFFFFFCLGDNGFQDKYLPSKGTIKKRYIYFTCGLGHIMQSLCKE